MTRSWPASFVKYSRMWCRRAPSDAASDCESAQPLLQETSSQQPQRCSHLLPRKFYYICGVGFREYISFLLCYCTSAWTCTSWAIEYYNLHSVWPLNSTSLPQSMLLGPKGVWEDKLCSEFGWQDHARCWVQHLKVIAGNKSWHFVDCSFLCTQRACSGFLLQVFNSNHCCRKKSIFGLPLLKPTHWICLVRTWQCDIAWNTPS